MEVGRLWSTRAGSKDPRTGGQIGPSRHVVARPQWLTPIILATQEAEIRRIKVQSQSGQIVYETLS
jgi:hypothetical protein